MNLIDEVLKRQVRLKARDVFLPLAFMYPGDLLRFPAGAAENAVER